MFKKATPHTHKRSKNDKEENLKNKDKNQRNQAFSHPAAVLQRVNLVPGRSTDILMALQKTVGNRTVQRLVDSGVVQRHLSEAGLAALQDMVTGRLMEVHGGQVAVGSSAGKEGNRVHIEAEWLE